MATGSSLSAADKALSTTEEKTNFIRLTRLLMCGGLALLREVFDNIHPPASLPALLGNPAIKKQLETLRKKRVLFPSEWERLYNLSGVYGKSADFDISLLCKLLREICNLTAPTTGWDNMPNSTDHSLQAYIVRIRCYRNTIYGHNNSMEVTDADFEKFWIEIREALLRIAGHLSSARRDEWKTSIEKLLHDPLTQDEKKICLEEFQLWCLKEYKKLSEKVEDQGEKIKKLQFEQQLMQMGIKSDLEKSKDKDIKHHVVIYVFLEGVNASGGSSVSSHELPMPEQVESAQSSSVNVETHISIALEQPPEEGTTRLSTGTELQVSQQNRHLVLEFWSAVYSFGKSSVNLLIRYLKEKLGVEVQECSQGSLIIKVSCRSLEVLEALWIEYCTGHLNKVVQDTLVTPEVLEKLDLREAKLRTVISEKDYLSHKEFLKNRSDKRATNSPQPAIFESKFAEGRSTMASLSGILLDVSGSMRRSIGTGTDEEGGPWARSIFEVIDNFVKHDVPSDNHVFAIGFGANCGVEMFDIIGTLKKIEKQRQRIGQAKITEIIDPEPVTPTQIDLIFHKLEGVGAHTIRKWVTEEEFSRVVTDDMAVMLLNKFESDKSFLKKFVQEFLPPASRDWSESLPQGLPGHLYSAQSAAATVTSRFKRATVEDIREVISRVTPYLVDEKREKVEPKLLEEKKGTVGVTVDSIFNVQEASYVLHGCFDEKDLSKERSRELLKNVEPYIYGEKPLYQSIEKATELFQTKASFFSSHKKLLFILSDGEPTDGQTTDRARIARVVSKLTRAGVTVVSCSITDSASINPRRLFSKVEPAWDRGAKLLFSLSSKLSMKSLPRTIFVKRDWTIDDTSNETHLFLQVNHPKQLPGACKLAQDVYFCKDTLSDVLASVELDMFQIKQDVEAYKAEVQQTGKACHANACATVLYLSMKRILGRKGGHPCFQELRDECIRRFSRSDGVSPLQDLQEICLDYRLRCREVDLKDALEAVSLSRPVIASCWLTEDERDSFRKFFGDDRNRTGILTRKEIDLTARPPDSPTRGHSFVLTSFDSESLRLLNSWGEDWGDKGFFRVQSADVLGLTFIDVYWTEKDLTEEEQNYFVKHESADARKLMTCLASLKRAEYTCPMAECSKRSPVMEFTGFLSCAKCPKCGKEVSTENAQEGNILALSIYLTSLIR